MKESYYKPEVEITGLFIQSFGSEQLYYVATYDDWEGDGDTEEEALLDLARAIDDEADELKETAQNLRKKAGDNDGKKKNRG